MFLILPIKNLSTVHLNKSVINTPIIEKESHKIIGFNEKGGQMREKTPIKGPKLIEQVIFG